MVELRELLEGATASPMGDPPLRDITAHGRRRRVARRAVGVAATVTLAFAAGATVFVLLEGADAPQIVDQPDGSPTPPSSTSAPRALAPSQSAADAARDGVLPAVAALPFDVRVEPQVDGLSPKLVTDEGVWITSRLSDRAESYADGCGLGAIDDPEAVYGRDVICTSEYGEVLLLDASESRILRAFPLPSLPPQALTMTDEAIYCSRQGDGALPDSMLCRIDRDSFDWHVRVFQFPTEADRWEFGEDRFLPGHWTVDEPRDWTASCQSPFVAGPFLLPGPRNTVAFDLDSLEVIEDPPLSQEFGYIVDVDQDAGTITLDGAEWLSGEEANQAYEDETGDAGGAPNDYYIRNLDAATVEFPVGASANAHMSFLWDDPGNAGLGVLIDWRAFAGIWADDATDVYAPHHVEYARTSPYWLVLLDGQVVRIEQQYVP